MIYFMILIGIFLIILLAISLGVAGIVYFISMLFTKKKTIRNSAGILTFFVALAFLLIICGVVYYASSNNIKMALKRPTTQAELDAMKDAAIKREEKINNIKPINYEESLKIKEINPVLPSSAKKIYFYEDTPFFFTFTWMLRFEAPLDDIERYVQEILRVHPAAWKKIAILDGRAKDLDWKPFLTKSLWFDFKQIVNGTCYSYNYNNEGGAPTIHQSICIDLDNSIFYWEQND